jgi:hypothetical protein
MKCQVLGGRHRPSVQPATDAAWGTLGATKQISLLQHQALNIGISIMSLSTMHADVTLYLMKFIKPVDSFNLLISGILKGFENVTKEIDLQQRYS